MALYAKGVDIKDCVVCGAAFERPRGVVPSAWARRVCCSRECGARLPRKGRYDTPALKRCEVCGLAYSRPPGLDFSLPDRKLNVEIDGEEHGWTRRRLLDEARDAELERRGWRILRIPNEEVDADPEAVVARIFAWIG